MKNIFFILYVLFILGCKNDSALEELTQNETTPQEPMQNESSLEEPIIKKTSIAKWWNNYDYAISMMWDDANTSHYTYLAPIFDSYGFKTTFAVQTVSSRLVSYKELALRGHEIASHSVNHINMSVATKERILSELIRSKDTIIKKIGIVPTTFVHPYNRISEEFDYLTYEYFLFSRLIDSERDKDALIRNIVSITSFASLVNGTQRALEKSTLVIFAGHGIGGGGWQPLPTSILIQFLQYIKDESKAWLTTHHNVSLYNRVRNKVKVSYNNSTNTVEIDDSEVDYKKYSEFQIKKIPITVILSSEKKLTLTGDNISEICYGNKEYIVSIDLLKGNSFQATESDKE